MDTATQQTARRQSRAGACKSKASHKSIHLLSILTPARAVRNEESLFCFDESPWLFCHDAALLTFISVISALFPGEASHVCC
jgi:hypothetical protein